MTFNPERWYALSSTGRGLCWLLFTLMLAVLGWWRWLHPQRLQISTEAAQIALQRQHLTTRWREVLLMKTSDDARIDNHALASPFSPLDFQMPDTRLVSWQPVSKGGTLVLDTSWQPVPGIFSLLAQQDMTVTAFALEPVAGRLRFTLQLEPNDAR
ncbi:hypothetical protein [Superficieibacter sp. HKU1]|uniref:HofO family protein n=1 Tax=Superficieibacter sp. HKU1 TaxID=3031919 RepID=UPI0023E2B921|nr:hypothetical protein [Superficieibacter sp. HKU1]WES68819.1 hypothetical protein P0H77_02035 [Superficieibacter sp. HKU1]